MNTTTPNMRLIYLAAIVMCTVLSLTGARGDDKTPAQPKMAVVNMGRLINEYKFTVSEEEKLKKKNDDILTELSTWETYRLYSEADQHILGEIAVKENNKIELTAMEKATKQKLDDAYKHLFDEYGTLQTNKMPTPQDEARFRALTQLEQATERRINEKRTSAKSELDKQFNDAQIQVDKEVREGISKVAKAKGCNLVFSSVVVFYCDNDLTDEVLKTLNH